MENHIYTYLKNANRPVYSPELERAFNLSGQKVRECIRKLRREGIPVVGSAKGYFEARNRQELEDLIINLEGRAKSMFKTVSMLKKARENKKYQQFNLF